MDDFRAIDDSPSLNSTDLFISGLATFVVENVAIVGFGISGINGVERTGPVEETFESWFVKQA